MPTIKIDGKSIEVEPGQMLIEAAESVDVTVPRFCYHKKLSIAANCRMCLVEVEGAPKVVPACATPVSDGMVVNTRSTKAITAQKAVMEFLLINHPLDCPICDQGGQCELQDVAMGYGSDLSTFSEGKRAVPDQDIGPLIQTEMTRCIHCTRCVRFGDEVAGIREMGATGRGEHVRIGTFLEKSIDSNLSGNVIDLCPVGALTSKPFRYRARAWEMTERDAVASHDCLGSNVHVHIRRNVVQRVAPRENEVLNEVWLSDRDRFSYEGYNSSERLSQPQIKVDGEWKTVCWEKALSHVANKTASIAQASGPDALGFIASPNATVEEAYLLQKIARFIGTNNVDHRLRLADTSAQTAMPQMPTIGITMPELEQAECVVIIGGNINDEVPLIAQRLRKAALAGAKIFLVDIDPRDQIFDVAGVIPVSELDYVKVINDLVGDQGTADYKALREALNASQKKHILLGCALQEHPDFGAVTMAAKQLADKVGATYGFVTSGANTAGVSLAGCLPHRAVGGATVPNPGLSALEMFKNPRKAYWVLGNEPEHDSLEPITALSALEQAEFVVCVSPFLSATMHSYADVVLPMALPYETAGAFISGTGQWQNFTAGTDGPGETKPAWKILRVLGNLLEVPGCDYLNTQMVRAAIRSEVESVDFRPESVAVNSATKFESSKLYCLPYVPQYSVDGVVRRATSLQKTHSAVQARVVRLSAEAAKAQNLTDGQMVSVKQNEETQAICLPCQIDVSLPANAVVLPWAIKESIVLRAPYQTVEIQPA